MMLTNEKSGNPYNRGEADSYYHRDFDPHFYPNLSNLGMGTRYGKDMMSDEQIAEYTLGYDNNERVGCKKEWT